MTAAPRRASSLKLHCDDLFLRAELVRFEVRPMPFGKKRERSTEGAQRGTGPSSYTRIAEITSGRAIYQQGLATTCKDPSSRRKLETEGGIWSGAWARMSDEGGVMFSEATPDVAPAGVTPQVGRRSPGDLAVLLRGGIRTQCRGVPSLLVGRVCE